MASYIIVCSEVRSTIGGVKTCFPFSFSGVLVSPGMNPYQYLLLSICTENIEKLQMNINGIATFRYKITPLNFDTQIMKIYFNLFHISVDFKFKNRSNN